MKTKNSKNTLSRRDFLKSSAVGALGAVIAPSLITTGCSSSDEKKYPKAVVPELLPQAPDGRPLKAGLIGCGGRGTGAAVNFRDAGNGLTVTMLADIFPDKLDACRKTLKGKGIEVTDENCFLGFDAYKKVIDSDVDVVLLCTPPAFRAQEFAYAVEKGKHVFLEKPCAVDPVGARSILKSAKIAEQKGLSVISGTIRRSQRDCIETYRRVAEGAIGDIVSAQVIRNGGTLWHKKRQPEWNDMEYLMRNWPNFCCISGDMPAEQFIHEIDMMSWFLGDEKPQRAIGYGGRQRRVSGDVYDFFSIQYIYDNGMRTNCASRQIDGCDNELSVMVYGTNGSTNCFDTIYNPDGTVAWQYPKPAPEDPDQTWAVKDPYVQEHIRLVTAIRNNEPLNDAETHVQSVLMAIMGRMAAYTGKSITWDELIASDLKITLDQYEFGPIPGGLNEVVPKPGTDSGNEQA